jgi:transglutaminase-like putative cysteine protease
MVARLPTSATLQRAERLTLAVLMCGVAALAFSDFVSPVYWLLVTTLAVLRLWRGPGFALTELQASMIGWAGFLWVGLELALGRALVVAFTDFLLILALAVAIEAATPRNHLHRMLVGLFLILGAAVLTDSVLYALPLAAFVWFMWRAAACLYGMDMPGGDLPAAPPRREGRVMAVMGVVIVLLFVLLPRFDTESRLKPTQPRMETTGFSDQVQLGDFARELDATVVMRVEPAPGTDPEAFRHAVQGRYWRATPMSVYVKNGWRRAGERTIRSWPRGSDIRLRDGKGIRVAVYREATDHRYIMVPDGLQTIEDVPYPVLQDNGGSLMFRRAPSRRLRLVMQLGRHAMPEGLRPPMRAEESAGSVPAAVRDWALQIAGGAATPQLALKRMDAELHGWTYDLNAPIDNQAPLASFLRLKRGHCELYATTLALAARSLGVPARVVNGYYAGEWNATGGFLLLRQQHAHSWVEAWLNGRWQRFDPTPASRWQLSGVRFPQLDEVWESVKLAWYRYVLQFEESARTELITRFLQLLKQALPWLMLGAVGLFALLRLRRSGLPLLSRAPRRVRGMQALLDRWLARRGILRQPWQPLRTLPVPEHVDATAWRQLVQEWEQQAYGVSPAWNRRILWRRLRAL